MALRARETPYHPRIVIATAWETAEWVAAMPVSAGAKYYLIHSHVPKPLTWTTGVDHRAPRLALAARVNDPW